MVKEPEQPKTQIAPRKSSLEVAQSKGGQWAPSDIDPELANLALARLLVDRMGTPSRINPVFNARKAMLKALNHREPTYALINGIWTMTDPGNPTGYDCSLRIAAYEHWELGSVNVDGWYGEKIWAFLMKPKMIITGLAGQAGLGEEEEQKQSLIGRLWGKITGRGKSEQPNNSQ